MAITFRSASTISSSSGTVTVTKPTGTASGDVLIAVLGYWAEAVPVTGPSGWTLLDTEINSAATYNQADVWYKVAGGSEPADYSWTFGGSLDEVAIAMAAYIGVNTTTPVQTWAVNANSANETFDAPELTLSAQPAMLLVMMGSNASGMNTGHAVTPPSGYTERAEVHNTSYGGAYIAEKYVTATGATGQPSATNTAASADCTYHVALNEATAGGSHSLTLTGITTAAPTVDNVVLAQKHGLAATAITTANAQVADIVFNQNRILTATAFSTGNPTLESPVLFQGISVVPITTAAPTVANLTMTQVHVLSGGGSATDTFTTGADAALETYSANWTINSGSFAVNAAGDYLYPTTTGAGSAAHWNAASFSNNQYAQGVISNTETVDDNTAIGVAVRCAASGDTYYGLFYYALYGVYLTCAVDGVGVTPLGSDEFLTIAPGDVLRLEVSGTTLTPKLNGALITAIGTVEDSTLSSGFPGVSGYGTTVDARLDNWQGGDLVGADIGFSTGAPTVANATLSLAGTLTASAITTAAPTLATLNINPDPFFVNATLNSSTGSTTISVTTPTNVTGDLIIVGMAWELSNASVTPVESGWNVLWNSSNAARTHTQAAYWRRSGGSEPGSFSFTITSAEWAVGAISIRNASNPYSASAQFNNSQVQATTAPTVVTTRNNDLLVFIGSSMNGTTYTAPTNFTERMDTRTAVSASGVSITIDTYLQPTAGSSGTIAATANTGDYNVGGSLALTKQAILHVTTPVAITTAAPTLENLVMGHGYAFGVGDMTTGQPTVAAATFSQNQVIAVNGITTGNPTVGTLSLAGLLELVAIAPSIGPPTVDNLVLTQAHSLAAGTISAGAPGLDSLEIFQNTAVVPVAITTGSVTLENATLAQRNALIVTVIDSGIPVLDSPSVTQSHTLTADDVTAGTPNFENPGLLQNFLLAPVAITTGAVDIAVAALLQQHVIVLTGITTSEPTIDQLGMNGATALAPVTITMGLPTVGNLAVAQAQSLAATGLTTGAPTFDSVALTQAHALAGVNVTTGSPTVDDTAITQVHYLAPLAVTTAAPTVDAISLTPAMEIGVNGITTGQPDVPPIAAFQKHVLNSSDITTGLPQFGTPTVSVTSVVAAENITTGNAELESPTWTVGRVLQANGITAGEYFLPNPVVLQVSILTAEDITTGVPIISTLPLGIGNALMPENIEAGQPTVGNLQVAIQSWLTADGIVTGLPDVGQILVSQHHYLIASTIETDEPSIGSPTINPGLRTPGRHTFSTDRNNTFSVRRSSRETRIRSYGKRYDVK